MPRVAIVGSGFGGSIAALRYREKGWDVDLYELGEDWPSSKMRQTQDTRYIYRLFRDYPYDYWSRTDTLRPKVVVAQGMGVGGGSLVYSGIHLRAPSSALAGWPYGWRRPDLDPYYSRVETNLRVQQYPRTNGYDFARRSVFAQGAAWAGLPAPQANPLAFDNCEMCGWCVPNCVFDRKMSMPMTYLARAKSLATGSLSIWPQRKAMRVERLGDGRYRVLYHKTNIRRDHYQRVNSGTLYYLSGREADHCIVACGSIESPALLQRSTSYLYSFNTSYLGNGIDGTGDAVVGGIVPQTTDSHKGAIMMDHIDMGEYVLEDIHSIPVGVGVKYPISFPSNSDRGWGMTYKQKLEDFSKHMLGIAIMGKQASGTGGNISVSSQSGNAVLSSTAYQPPTGSINAARSIIEALGGEVAHTPWEREGMIATVHPSGGCAMGNVVQTSNLQVPNNTGLHVIDGSVLPSGVWRNPAHTISAVAEKALEAILGPAVTPTF